MKKSKIQAAFDKWHQKQVDELQFLIYIKDRFLAGEDPAPLMAEMELVYPDISDDLASDFARKRFGEAVLYQNLKAAKVRECPPVKNRSQRPEFDR